MQILSRFGDKTEYTWDQTWRFFLIGAVKTCGYAMVPVGAALFHDWVKSHSVDWSLLQTLAVSGAGLRLLAYWNEHKAMLKMPPIWAIPPDWEPSTVTVERSSHTTTVKKETEAGTTTTTLSPHTSTRVFGPTGTGDGDGTKP